MGSNRIKGITIEIGGDTTKLSQSLKGIDSSLKNTQSQLKDVNSLLKFNPGNTELLTQKQTLLANSVKQTKERSDELKKALAEMDANNVDKTSEQYQALQREIIATDGKLDSLKKTQAEFGNVASQQIQIAGDNIIKYGDKISKVGDTLTKSITLPITAIGAASVAAFNEVDKGSDIIVEKTGATGDSLEEMNKSMENIATSIPTDFETAGSAIGEVNTRFGLTGQALEDLSTQFVEFAKVNNTDVSTSVDNVQKVMAAFNVPAEDANQILDTMNSVGQSTGISMDTLAGTMSSNASSLQEMGLNAYSSAKFLGEVEVSGSDTSAVMAGLKKALTNASAEGKPMAQALQEIQDEMQNGTDSTKVMNDAVDLFGSKAAPQIVNACKSGKLSFNDLSVSASDAAGSVSNTFNGTLDPIDEWEKTLNKLKVTGAKLGNSLSKVLQPAIEKVGGYAEKLADWFDGLSDSEKEQVVNLALMVAAAGPVIKIAGKGVSAIGACVKGFGQLSAGASVFVTAMKDGEGASAAFSAIGLNPMALAITAGVVAFGALAIACKNSSDQFRQQIKDQYGLTDAEQSNIDKINEQADAYGKLKTASKENSDAVVSQFGHYEDLANEYDTLLDANGQVKEGEEDRANFITTTLSQALGIEGDDLQDLINKNGNLSSAIDDVMTKKKAQAMLDAYQDQYTEAIKEQKNALVTYAKAQEDYNNKVETGKEAQARYKAALEAVTTAQQLNGAASQTQLDELNAASLAYGDAKAGLDATAEAQQNASDTLIGYNATIANYEGVSAAIISGDTASINTSLDNLTNGFITAENGTRQSLENQVTNMNQTYQQLDAAVKSGAPGVTQSMVDNAKAMVDKANEELEKLPPDADAMGNQYKMNIDEDTQAAVDAAQINAQKLPAATNVDLSQSATSTGGSYKDNVTSEFNDAESNVSGSLDTMSNDASNTSFDLSKYIALPHFGWSGDFSLDPLQIPHVTIDWYKKAMQRPYLLSGATIFGQTSNGQYLGGGEAGNEVIMSEQLANSLQGRTVNNSFTIIQQPGQDARSMALEVGRILNDQTCRKDSVWK